MADSLPSFDAQMAPSHKAKETRSRFIRALDDTGAAISHAGVLGQQSFHCLVDHDAFGGFVQGRVRFQSGGR